MGDSEKGWAEKFWVDGVVLGDFSEEESWWKVTGQVLIGLVPYAGQVADIRDIAANIKGVAEGKEGAWLNLGLAGIGIIPLFGDLAKGGVRLGRQAAKEGVEAGLDASRKVASSAPTSAIPTSGPGSAAHKAERWAEYQARGGKWSQERWSNVYEQNMKQARLANQATDAYHARLGWGTREVTVDVEGVPRRLDIADVARRRGVEHKTGYQTADQDNLWEVARDKILVEQGWDIKWQFDGTASAPLLRALDEAGIPHNLNK